LSDTSPFLPWDVAWHDALYGEGGFYRRPPGPAGHFRTSVHVSSLLAEALVRLARSCGLTRVVDIGSGRGELLAALSDVDAHLELVGVDVTGRPPLLVERARWLTSPGGGALPDESAPLRDALVVAHEWLDDVPCPVVQVADDGGWRQVEVTRDGRERLGGEASPRQLEWLARWWPPGDAGARAEVGLPRDEAWAQLVSRSPGSVLVAVDYAHDRATRPQAGTLAGYRDGRMVPPVPDGTCDVTAHVALDSVARAGEAAGAVSSVLTTQRSALRALGVTAERPDPSSARHDPARYLAALQRAGEAAELIDPAGLGGFRWLLQSRGPGLTELE
jgi:SAM-dependent MidA family methyltransferase